MTFRFQIGSISVVCGSAICLAVALGCSSVAGETAAAESEPSASPPVSEATVGEWRTKVATIRTDLETLAKTADNTNSPAMLARLRDLAGELQTLERQLAGATVVTAAKPVAEMPEAPVQPLLANHPFGPAVARAKKALAKVNEVKDYTALISKRERSWDGKLGDYEYLQAKVRHEPFSVYLRFLGPQKFRGREVIYVAGQNNGNLLAHEPHRGLIGLIANKTVGTIALAPTSALAMGENRYPITDIGIQNLTRKLIEEGEKDMRFAGADAKFYPNARVNDRSCEAYVFLHPDQDKRFKFHRAEVFIDKELQLPIRYASYGWPTDGDSAPVFGEEYTYSNLKLNVGLTDEDFSTKNKTYEFPQ